MSITTNGRNEMLDALDVAYLSLHTDYPDFTGANEVTGGSYARKAATFGAAAGSERALSAAVTIDVPACTVAWIGAWAADNTTFQMFCPNGGSPKEFIADPSTDIVTSPAHGYSDTQAIVFWGGNVPTPLVAGTVYYVRDATTDTFKVAATSGGSAIDITGGASTSCLLSKIVPEVYAGAGTHTVSAWAIGLTH